MVDYKQTQRDFAAVVYKAVEAGDAVNRHKDEFYRKLQSRLTRHVHYKEWESLGKSRVCREVNIVGKTARVESNLSWLEIAAICLKVTDSLPDILESDGYKVELRDRPDNKYAYLFQRVYDAVNNAYDEVVEKL